MNEQKDMSWLVVIIACIFFWPIGLFLLWRKLSVNKKAAMNSGKFITTIGWILVAIGTMGIAASAEGPDSTDMTLILFFVGGGIGLIFLGNKAKKQAQKYKKYITIVINQQETDIDIIASVLNIKVTEVREDLEKMIDKGFFQNAYIDERKGKIIINNNVTQTSKVQVVNNEQMKVAQCKNCSATNKVTVGRVGECEYCGSLIN